MVLRGPTLEGLLFLSSSSFLSLVFLFLFALYVSCVCLCLCYGGDDGGGVQTYAFVGLTPKIMEISTT